MAGEQTFGVEGMTCDHCVRAVTEAVSTVPGVTEVRVDLAAGTVTVGAPGGVTRERVRAAIEEAGYTPAPA